ncbi:hypothetical protein T265_11191 [Opisthorchis viverrini]|uniref:Peptidase C13 family protein n=1 Tax=Opisthorchis viverrini TaxID=6198 RepID=A0A074ZAG7_OPIVI|nr:hypothetical protein T265_11191 [Opisthorchis viverrini]KER20205.1 hypothetical protein T265_11191 [Opisthorchis viverrini]
MKLPENPERHMELEVNLDMMRPCSVLIAFLFCINHVAVLEGVGFQNCSSIFYNQPSKNWVVLVAGSKTWRNYRHQADVFHAYQLVRKNNVPPENIITFAYDDIANNPNDDDVDDDDDDDSDDDDSDDDYDSEDNHDSGGNDDDDGNDEDDGDVDDDDVNDQDDNDGDNADVDDGDEGDNVAVDGGDDAVYGDDDNEQDDDDDQDEDVDDFDHDDTDDDQDDDDDKDDEDDINPFKGQVFNHYDHLDVYNGVVIDYRGKVSLCSDARQSDEFLHRFTDVTRDNFVKVLKGDEKLEADKKKVLKRSSPYHLLQFGKQLMYGKSRM